MKRFISILVTLALLFSLPLATHAEEGSLMVKTVFQTSGFSDLGLDAQNVRIGWQLTSKARSSVQTAYQLLLQSEGETVFDSGVVESAAQTGIALPNLSPETMYTYKVRVRDGAGLWSDYSLEGQFETAPATLEADAIGAGDMLLRKEITLNQPVSSILRARAYVGGASIVETRINGQKVGDLVLAPSKPVPDVTVCYNTYDILPYLQDGENVLGLASSDVYPMGGPVTAMFKILYQDGSTQVIATDDTWLGRAVTAKVDYSNGEDFDATFEAGWDTSAFTPGAAWASVPVQKGGIQGGQLVAPAEGAVYYTKNSYSGAYTIRFTGKVTLSAIGILFGSGDPNAPMWQFNMLEHTLRKHMPGQWNVVDTVACPSLQLNETFTAEIAVNGATVTTSVNGQVIDTTTLTAAQTQGRIGLRHATGELYALDSFAVEAETGGFVEEFDSPASQNLDLPELATLEPAITAAKVMEEIAPVSVTEINQTDKSKPYTENGSLIMPATLAEYYTKQSFSGDYSIELKTTVYQNAFALLFGSGDPYPAMWQLNVIELNILKPHLPGNWDVERVPCDDIVLNQPITMRLDIAGGLVTTYVNGEKLHEKQLTAQQVAGPLGLRIAANESYALDYIRVTQNGQVIWEDNFDLIDTTKWNFPSQDKKYILDFGKNMAGFVRVNCDTPNTTFAVRYGELLNADGTLNQISTFHKPVCTYTTGDTGAVFEPKFFYTGFRYVELDGFPGNPAEDVVACFVREDAPRAGSFSSSDSRLDACYDLYRQSQLSNLISVYTDCPQREKDGWTGDASAVKEAASYVVEDYRVAEYYMRVALRNVYPNGQPMVRVPKPASSPQGQNEFGFIDPPWTSAYFVFPYETYMQTGDPYYINMAYDSLMKIWKFYEGLDTDGDYLITINTFGDWIGYDNQEGKVDKTLLSSAYAYYSGCLLAEMAEITGRDHSELDSFLANMKQALQRHFDQGSHFSNNIQTANAMALDFDLATDPEKVLDSLVQNAAGSGYTLRTGTPGTKPLYDALSAANAHDVLLLLTTNSAKPSFGYMLDHGATTSWEYWDKFGEGFNSQLSPDIGIGAWDSQNHPMLGGGMGTWVFEGLGGIRQTQPAYHGIHFRAGVESGLTEVNSTVNTIIGEVTSNWTYENDLFTWEITVPAGSTATVEFPFDALKSLTESGVNLLAGSTNDIRYVDGTTYAIGSGTYHFTAVPGSIGIYDGGQALQAVKPGTFDVIADKAEGTMVIAAVYKEQQLLSVSISKAAESTITIPAEATAIKLMLWDEKQSPVGPVKVYGQ